MAFLLDYTAGLELGPAAFAPAQGTLAPTASPQDRLLHRLGRSPAASEEVR